MTTDKPCFSAITDTHTHNSESLIHYLTKHLYTRTLCFNLPTPVLFTPAYILFLCILIE